MALHLLIWPGDFLYPLRGINSAAAKALITALESALGGDEIYFAVQILVALGINLADQGDHALALSTLAYAAAHPALTHHDQALVQTQIEILQDSQLPPNMQLRGINGWRRL